MTVHLEDNMSKKLVRINPNLKSLKKLIGKKKHYAVIVMIKDGSNNTKRLCYANYYGYSLALRMMKKATHVLFAVNSIGDEFGTRYK